MSRRYTPARIRKRTRPVNLEEAYRLIPTRHVQQPLGTTAQPSRFSDPRHGYSVLYAAQSVRCATWEALLRDRFTRRRRRLLGLTAAKTKSVVTVYSSESLQLVDLRGDGPVRIGAPTAVAHHANHAAGQALSSATYKDVPEADGFLYASRFTGHACIAVFDRATPKLAVRAVVPLVEHADFLETLVDYGISLVRTGPKA